MISMEVSSKDQAYDWVSTWIATHGARVQHLSVNTSFSQSETGKISTKFNFVPGIGNHFFRYKGNWVSVEKSREKQMIDFNKAAPMEFVTLRALGSDRNYFVDILTEAREIAFEQMEGKTVMYTAMGSEWRPFGYPRKKRPIESVVLSGSISEHILRDIRDFTSNSKWYSDRGIPYRRGYLLHGPPGCGKSSYITALAGTMDYSICVMNLSERGMTDDRLQYLLATAPEHSIILLEDIDAAFVSREDTEQMAKAYQGMGRLTLSGVLNALDGVASAEARIIVMTTNYKERLDPALIRPGRVDMKVRIDYCTPEQIYKMFARFYPDETHESVQKFVDRVVGCEKNTSAAQIQGLFLQFKDEPHLAYENIELIWHS